ncbi:exo-alpha-sialidase [Hyphomicrobium denitrificans]|uniref:exo-alpha-sialidase n=1 Tax=Hyphomicrobium denitrificans TaxID=53399 RepID=UPI00022E59CE|nr:sialidase family protein [Hyphomicrobium denitrificans]
MDRHATKTLATWAAFGCSVVLAALLLYKMANRIEPWTFVVDVPQAPVRGDLEIQAQTITPPDEKDFVHGPSLIETPTGLLAFWYRAVYEGAANAELVSARFDGDHWSPTAVVTNSNTVTRDIGLTVKSLANPVPFRRSPNEIWLFFAASRLSGWATCEIVLIRSVDNGRTWSPAQRLYASPFLNMSHLTKSLPIRLSGDRIALPAYHEMNRKYPVMLVLDRNGRVIDKLRMGNGGTVGYQPAIVATGPTTAIAFVRRLNSFRPQRILMSHTVDAGRTWTPPTPIDLPNPGGPIAAIRYDDTRILLAFNDDPDHESNVKLAFSNLDGTSLRRIGTVAQKNDRLEGDAVAYPFLIESEPGQFDVVFSRPPPQHAINHVRVSSAWIEHNLKISAAQK